MNVYLGLGSNMGNRAELLTSAIELIKERIGTVMRQSAFIETAPWGFVSEHPFLNAAVLCETELMPIPLLDATQQIERELGRVQKSCNGRYHDRTIDIDILYYGNEVIDTPRLQIPHPLIRQRDFVLIPLRDIDCEYL